MVVNEIQNQASQRAQNSHSKLPSNFSRATLAKVLLGRKVVWERDNIANIMSIEKHKWGGTGRAARQTQSAHPTLTCTVRLPIGA